MAIFNPTEEETFAPNPSRLLSRENKLDMAAGSQQPFLAPRRILTPTNSRAEVQGPRASSTSHPCQTDMLPLCAPQEHKVQRHMGAEIS